MRRSCIGRASVSRGVRGSGRGATVVVGGTERAMARWFLPPVQARDKSFGVGVRSGGQLHEAIRSAERGEIAGAVRRGGVRPGAAPIVYFDFYRQEIRERRFHRDRGRER